MNVYMYEQMARRIHARMHVPGRILDFVRIFTEPHRAELNTI